MVLSLTSAEPAGKIVRLNRERRWAQDKAAQEAQQIIHRINHVEKIYSQLDKKKAVEQENLDRIKNWIAHVRAVHSQFTNLL